MRDKIFIEEKNLVDLSNMDNKFFLIGVLNEFMNRFQATADKSFEEISWKQCFTLNCIRFFNEPPTLKELSDMLGSSHQNTKQILLKLEKNEYVKMIPDLKDRRKQRIIVTEKVNELDHKYSRMSEEMMSELFGVVNEEMIQTTINTIVQLSNKLERMQSSEG